MKNALSFYHAKLVSENTFSVMVFTALPRLSDNIYVFLVKDYKIIERCVPSKSTSMNNVRFYEFKMGSNYDYGHHYEIFLPNFGSIPLDVSDAIYFEHFDDKFYYDGDDLGATYHKSHTDFALWAPLASSVYLSIIDKDEKRVNYEMKRHENGVYRVSIEGDLNNVAYQYIVTNSEISREVNDPYAKSVTLNSQYSAVVDINSVKKQFPNVNSNLNKENLVDSSIYELNIRDFSIDKSTNIKNKGKYLGLIEENKKTKKGNPAGLDYLKFLGISHVQLLPVLDFANVDDTKPLDNYNWGYDVTHFFALEGSYSLHPEIPDERIKEFKQVVNTFHENRIGVIVDVVYNHIFSYESSLFEKILPGYYFRKSNDGRIINGSGCGNDIASERKMVKKLIIDSVLHLIDTYDIDGLRFDLMGLLDIDTINKIQQKANAIKKNFIIYGEGWHIPTGIPGSEQTSIMNAFKTENIGFFNDAYRDILKGSCFDISKKGYINGDYSYIDGAFYSMMATCVNYAFQPRFKTANQSINYVECHDNGTIYDKFLQSLEEDDEQRLNRIKLINAVIAFSFGVPFYHMGQEIGLSKHLQDNTYNMGDKYNKMDYTLLDERFDMAVYLKDLIAYRKELKIYSNIEPKCIEKIFHYMHKLENGVMRLEVKGVGDDRKDAILCINPSSYTQYFELDDYYDMEFSSCGKSFCHLYCKNVTQPPISLVWLIKK